MKKVAVVILNWNTKDYLRKFLPGVLASAGCAPDGDSSASDHEVIVADSASTDGSMEVMAELFPKVRTIILDRNYGFTGGYNRALAQLQGQFEYYLLLNSDIDVPRRWLGPLVEWMESHPRCGACAPKLHSWYEKDMFEYAGAAGGYLDRFGYPFCRGRVMKSVEKDKGQYDGHPNEVFWASGAALMVRSHLWHRMGGLDDRFFAHMEEIDLCWRLQLAGYTVCVVPGSTVLHLGGGTLPATSPFKLRLNFRNNLLMLSNNLAKSYGSKIMRKTGKIDVAAHRGWKKAQRVIFLRMLLDGASAMVYLLTFKPKYFRAVIDAHEEYRKLDSAMSEAQLWDWLSSHAKDVDIHGWYKGWIVYDSLRGRRQMWRRVHRFRS